MNYKTLIEKLGYIVSSGKYDNRTEIKEPFKSFVTGEIRLIDIAFSSKKDDAKFLEKVYNSLIDN